LLVSSLTVYLITTEAESELVAEPTTELVEAEEGGQEEPIQYEVKEAPSMELTAAGSPDLQDAPPALVEEEPTPVTAAQLPPTQQAKVTTTESSAKSVARSQQSSYRPWRNRRTPSPAFCTCNGGKDCGKYRAAARSNLPKHLL